MTNGGKISYTKVHVFPGRFPHEESGTLKQFFFTCIEFVELISV